MTESAAWRVTSRTTLLIFGLVLLTWLLVALQSIVIQLLLASIVAAAIGPPVDRLTGVNSASRSRWRPGRAGAALLVYLCVITILVLVGALVAATVGPDVITLANDAPGYLQRLQLWISETVAARPELQRIVAGLDLGALAERATSWASTVFLRALDVIVYVAALFGGALELFFTLFLALYLTVDGARIQAYVVEFLPLDRQARTNHILNRISGRLGAWARGQLALCAIIGGLTYVGLLVIGVPYASVLAVFAFFGELIPTVGPILSAIPAIVIAFIDSPTKGMLVLGLVLVIQQLENTLVVPRVMGRAIELHPLVVMVAILVGSQLMGITGAILALPVAAALAVVVDEIRRDRLAANALLESRALDAPTALIGLDPVEVTVPTVVATPLVADRLSL